MHIYRDDLKPKKLHELTRSILQLVRVDAEPQAVEQVHCDLGVLDGLLLAASQDDDVVDVYHTSDFSAAQVLDCRLQKLGCDARCRGEAEGHSRTLVFYAVGHEPEELAVVLCNGQMHVEVGQVDFGHPVRSAEDLSHSAGALHFQVLASKVEVDRPEVDAAPQLIGAYRDRTLEVSS